MRYAEHEFLAISRSQRGCGLGDVMEREIEAWAHEMKLDFITSSTAFPATSSVKYHHKHGFRKFMVRSYASTNYYSWVFVKPIRKSLRMRLLLLGRIPVLLLSLILCTLLYDRNGTKRF